MKWNTKSEAWSITIVLCLAWSLKRTRPLLLAIKTGTLELCYSHAIFNPGWRSPDLIEPLVDLEDIEHLCCIAWMQNERDGILHLAISFGRNPCQEKSFIFSMFTWANLRCQHNEDLWSEVKLSFTGPSCTRLHVFEIPEVVNKIDKIVLASYAIVFEWLRSFKVTYVLWRNIPSPRDWWCFVFC